MRKKLFSFLVLSFAAVFAANQALAVGVSASQTGFEAGQNQTKKISSSFENSNINQESIVNNLDGSMKSGSGRNNSSGKADIKGDISSQLNSNEVSFSPSMDSGAVSASNSNTGACSENQSKTEIEDQVNVDNVNLAWVLNFVKIWASSGSNNSHNSSTGDASAEVTSKVFANSNMTDISSGMGTASVAASNTNTGCESCNKAQVSAENEIDVQNYNFADVANDIISSANTGSNGNENCGCHSSCKHDGHEQGCSCDSCGSCSNSTSTSSTSGDAKSIVSLTAQLNSNETTIDAGFEPAMIAAANYNTGFRSGNKAQVDVENEINVENENVAFINNIVDNEANSGNNNSNHKSWQNSSMSTGNATAQTQITNTANQNITDITGGMSGDVAASNSNTGCESYNEAEVNVENSIDVENLNVAEVKNYVKNISDAGNNSQNSGNGCFNCNDNDNNGSSTGDATSNVSIVNQLNMNQTTIDAGMTGDVSASNSMTGAKSENKAEANVQNSISVTNENIAEVCNNITVVSNSGSNSANYSHGADNNTGDAGASLIITNQSNRNVVEVQ